MLDSAGEPGEGQKAFISFAGKTIARRQIDLALALGCERVVCLAENLGPVLIGLQHEVEATGAKFHVISLPRALSGLVRSADELLVLADGVLPLAEEVQETLAKGQGVLTFSAEEGIPRGFERIDLNHAWSGALIMPGRLVERLNELPRDCDGVASLLRIALQGKVPERPLSDGILPDGRWAMLNSARDAELLEPGWFHRHVAIGDISTSGLGHWLGAWLAGKFGVNLLNRGVRPAYMLSGAGLLLVSALILGWLSMPGLGLILLALAWLVGDAASALDRGERAGNGARPGFARALLACRVMSDLILVALVSVGIGVRFVFWPERLFVPLILIGLVWLVPGLSTQRWGAICGDRILLALLLAAGTLLGVLLPVAQCLILVLLGCGIAFSRLGSRLTRV
ncbi:hypothetical protein MB02_13650 [Croceicoccus estronivorus]|nr:hypothetical protein MB02_13650 [Croceicoccus estronivorus]